MASRCIKRPRLNGRGYVEGTDDTEVVPPGRHEINRARLRAVGGKIAPLQLSLAIVKLILCAL
jgi:hypothetical protein